nr:MAG TPA: hypothetical protein [Caudoviricetes sp.]
MFHDGASRFLCLLPSEILFKYSSITLRKTCP